MRIEPAPSEPIAPATSPRRRRRRRRRWSRPASGRACHGLRVAPKAGPSVKGHWPISGALRLADDDRAGGAQAPHRLGVGPAWPVLAGAAERGRVAGEVDVVLDRDRHAEQRRPLAGGQAPSAASASASACSSQTIRKAFSVVGSSIRCSERSISSRELISPSASAAVARPDRPRGRWARMSRQARHSRPSASWRRSRRLDGDAGAAVGGEGDGAADDSLVGAVLGDQADPIEDGLEDDLHLVEGEAGAEATADAAAEGDPGVGAGRVVEEALGAEGLGLRVEVGPAVEQVDRGVDADAGRQQVAADLQRGGQVAADGGDDRPQPQRLLDRRVEVGSAGSAPPRRAARRPAARRRPGGGPGAPGSSSAPSRSSRGRPATASSARRAARGRLAARPSSSRASSSIERMSSWPAPSAWARRACISS